MFKGKVELAIWSTISLIFFLFVVFVEFVLSSAMMFELHMNSTEPGDFAFTNRSVILTDIAVYLGAPFLINVAIVCYWFVQTKRLFDPPILNQRISHRATLALCIVGALILNGHLIYSGVHYWQERAPFFAYKPNFP